MSVRLARTPAPRRGALVALLVIGLGLIGAPVVFQMFGRAPQGATMLTQFKPYMNRGRLAGYQRDIQEIDAAAREANTTAVALLAPSAARFAAQYPGVVAFQRAWRPADADMTHLLTTIDANVPNYQAVAALPRFTLFPWFFVIPGALLVVVGAIGLWRPSWPATRWALIALGVGLIAAPLVFQMFDRAPKGRRMIAAFKTIETRAEVERIQGYFASIAVGQGALRLQLVPALEHRGLTAQQVAVRLPAVATLDDHWVQILGDLTPMIGVMSDNVTRYDAVAALPSFSLFPWFFVLPGLLTIGLALLVGGPTASDEPSAPSPPPSGHRRPQPTGAA